MKKLIYVFLIILLFFSCTLIVDDSPVWSINNRMAVEQTVNCNTTKNSLGISGCAFIGEPDQHAILTINALWKTRVEFTSTNCESKSFYTQLHRDYIIPIHTLYTDTEGENCSFTLNRYVYLKNNKTRLDKSMKGRFFIKIVPFNRYHALLKFDIENNKFSGVGWYQRKYAVDAPPLKIHPQGSKGTFLLKCGDDTLINFDFEEVPFLVDIPQGASCDFEMSVINKDNRFIEFASLVYEEQGYTVDLHKPRVFKGKKYLHFRFLDDINLDQKKVVIGVQINDRICSKTYKCKDDIDRSEYVVRGITSGLRFFKGIYYPETKKWEIK